jgi:hypothetical protein
MESALNHRNTRSFQFLFPLEMSPHRHIQAWPRRDSEIEGLEVIQLAANHKLQTRTIPPWKPPQALPGAAGTGAPAAASLA